jgi:magnesium-transporting ATPase (P-type)
LVKGFDINSLIGLSEHEAAQRLKEEGYNELPSTKKRSLLAIAFGVVREPMFLLLAACGTIYLFMGDMEEALMLLGFVFVVIGITLYQERKQNGHWKLSVTCPALVLWLFVMENKNELLAAKSSVVTFWF